MTSKTIALTGAEIEVSGLNGANAHIRNDGTAAVYAAKTPGIVAGADDVASIPAGQSVSIRGISGRVYLLGTGSVYIQSDDYTACPFKTSAQAGGSGADEVARAAIEAHVGNADIHISAVEKAAWNGKAELSDIPASLPANGGNAETAKQVECMDIIGTTDDCTYNTILDWANHYTYQGCSTWAFIRSDYGYPDDAPEQYEAVVRIESDKTGARRLVTWARYVGNVSYVRSIFNNSWMAGWERTNDGGNADTLDGKHASDLAYLTNVIGGLRRGWASTDIGTIMTYGDRQVVKTTNDLSYFGWTVNGEGWFFPVIVSQHPNGTKYKMFGFDCGYDLVLTIDPDKVACFDYKDRTYYACWQNSGSLQHPAVSGGLRLEFANDYISMCKALIDACEAIDSDTVDGKHASDFALKTDIPTSLPADGGNADTVGTKSATQILAVKNRFSNDMNDLKEQGSYIAIAATNAPSEAWGTVCVYAGGSGSVVQIYVTDTGSESEQSNTFIRHFNGTFWSPWRSVFDNGNATTLETHPASDFVLKSEYDALAARVAALEGGNV